MHGWGDTGMQTRRTEFEAGVAKRIQAVRIEKGLSIAEVARVSGLSASYLSRVESGKAAVTLAGLHKLAGVLRVSVAALCGEAENGRTMCVFRGASKPKIERVKLGKSVLHYQLIAEAMGRKQMEPMLLRLDEAIHLPMNSHPGEEFIYVVEGEAVFCHAEKEERLSRGDGVYFDASLPHTARAVGGTTCLLLSVLATRDYLLHSDIFALLRT